MFRCDRFSSLKATLEADGLMSYTHQLECHIKGVHMIRCDRFSNLKTTLKVFQRSDITDSTVGRRP